MIQYHLPGIHVTEREFDVPLVWSSPEEEKVRLFVRELVDPVRVTEDLPLVTFLQGGPGGANPRPIERSGWIDEALKHYRIIMVDQRGTGRSSPLDARIVAARGASGADFLAHFRADSIVRDLEAVRTRLYGGRRWAAIAQSFGGWIALAYLSMAPEGLSAVYVHGGVPGIPADASEVYRRTFDRVARKTAEYYRRFPQDVDQVARIADRLASGDVTLPDGDVLTVHRFQSTGIDFGMKRGFERMHWLVDEAFISGDRFNEGFLAAVLARTSSASNPLFWTLQESIYGDGENGPTGWAAQRELNRRPEFGPDKRPMLFFGEMAFPWMFEEVRLLKGFRQAVEGLARQTSWSNLYDQVRLANNDVPVAAAVYFDDMYVDSGLQLTTLSKLGNAQYWVTNEFEHDGIQTPRVLARLRELVVDRGGEL
ncbi:alpha/beta fold hydrolase [Changpingibacter yushuensis]|uniref:alpha/beta fold hydrolase n=1 Tax=Changpingibacter yushuensis TaxID=2758440 RepID=UPI0015F3F581|nr:alpha/beta fold hydrolase [Changpingibacter yushuensis]